MIQSTHQRSHDEKKEDLVIPVDNGKIWTEIPQKHDIYAAKKLVGPLILIDHTFRKIDTIPGLKTNLYEHQKPVVRAMIDIEEARQILGTSNTIIKYSGAVLSEPVGSGKTIEILSLILAHRPKIIPDILTLSEKNANTSIPIRRKFKKILKPTIIFVGSSVLNQWISAISTFTNLSVFVVGDVIGLDNLMEKITNRTINKYHIVLVKNGKITRPVKNFPDHLVLESKNRISTPYIYNIISNIRNICWNRVVIDDFDTIGLPKTAGFINGLFTWFISSTCRNMPKNYVSQISEYSSVYDHLLYLDYGCSCVRDNRILFENINVRNKDSFIKKTTTITNPKFYLYLCKNPNNQYLNLLGSMQSGEINTIIEMINSNSLETAAEQVGIKSTSVSDMFKKILGKHFDDYKKAVKIINFIENLPGVNARLSGSLIPEDPEDPEHTYGKRHILAFIPPKYNYPNLKSLLAVTLEEFRILRETSGMAIQRVKDNIKQGECPICYNCFSDLDESEAYIILLCCGVVLCSTCTFGIIFKDKSIVGQCSNCRSPANIKNIIYLRSDFDTNEIMSDQICEADEICEADAKTPLEDAKNADLESFPKKKANVPEGSKERIILDIIHGKSITSKREVDVVVDRLIKGSDNTISASNVRKVLIFSNYSESLAKISKPMEDEEIKYWMLGGTHHEINTKVKAFQEYPHSAALLINSTNHCAGLNLQFATDLVFMHKIIDSNIESQVVGRGQRLGRTSTLNVHYVLYDNEYSGMSNRVRV